MSADDDRAGPSTASERSPGRMPRAKRVAEGAELEPYVEEIRGKAHRLGHARARPARLWRHLIHVGSLGFVFVLPLLAGAVIGRWVAARLASPRIALLFLLLGLLAGAYASWRMVRESLADLEDEEDDR